jgi:hypothetical protein
MPDKILMRGQDKLVALDCTAFRRLAGREDGCRADPQRRAVGMGGVSALTSVRELTRLRVVV